MAVRGEKKINKGHKGLKRVEESIRGTYLMVDPGVIKLIIACVVSFHIPGDPVWLFLVAPSGGGKTEFIMSINELKDVHPISTFTKNTLLSGQQGGEKEKSLLHRVHSGIFTFKDFTTILSMHRDERSEIMAQLREVYDGYYKKSFGTGDDNEWRGKIGFIAGVTTAIHRATEMYAAMGERFVMYSINQPDRIEAARKATDNTETILDDRKHIQEVMKNYFEKELKIPEVMPSVDKNFKEEILRLSELATRARSPIDRDFKSSSKDITFIHAHEMPTRFAAQLTTLAASFMIINKSETGKDELTKLDKNIIYKIALDSITMLRRSILRLLAEYEKADTKGVAIMLHLPTSTTRRTLEDLTALGMVTRSKDGTTDMWRLKANYRAIIAEFEDIRVLGGVLDDSTAKKEQYRSLSDVDKKTLDDEQLAFSDNPQGSYSATQNLPQDLQDY